MKRGLSKLQLWMLDRAAANNTAESDATQNENLCRTRGCDLYFCEVMDGYFNFRSRWPVRRRRTEYKGEVWYRLRRGHYSKFWPQIQATDIVIRCAARRLSASGLVSLHRTDGINLARDPRNEAISRRNLVVNAITSTTSGL
jgi:hypothetical protein